MNTPSKHPKKLDSSRRLEGELATQKYKQGLQTDKILKECEGLSRSRKAIVDQHILTASKQYKNRLNNNPDLLEDHLKFQKRMEKQKSIQAEKDFETQRQRLLQERNSQDSLDKQYRIVDKAILDLNDRSKLANEQEERKLNDLETRRKVVIKLLDESKRKELEHYDNSKAIATAK